MRDMLAQQALSRKYLYLSFHSSLLPYYEQPSGHQSRLGYFVSFSNLFSLDKFDHRPPLYSLHPCFYLWSITKHSGLHLKQNISVNSFSLFSFIIHATPIRPFCSNANYSLVMLPNLSISATKSQSQIFTRFHDLNMIFFFRAILVIIYLCLSFLLLVPLSDIFSSDLAWLQNGWISANDYSGSASGFWTRFSSSSICSPC